MSSPADEGVANAENVSNEGNLDEVPAVASGDVLPSLILQTDDVSGSGEYREDVKQQETVQSPKRSYTMPRVSRTLSLEPRPSIVFVVATEVATFYDVFGVLGVPMIIMFLVSAAWTFMMAVIQVHADSMANSIMNTTEFDNGEFWLLPQPGDDIIISSVVLLSLFGIGYTALAVTMIVFYRAGASPDIDESKSEPGKPTENANNHVATEQNWLNKSIFGGVFIWLRKLPSDVRDHYFTAALDLPKLIFQTLTLYTYLESGFPTPIIHYYSVLLLCNWLVASYRSQHYVVDPNLIIARLYYTFDLFFAVFAPLVILIYYILSFKFDRAAFMTRTETLSPGSFDGIARIFGEPSQISSFCSAFHYLQFSSGSTLFFKSSLNLLSLYKWRKIVMTLIRNHNERQTDKKRKAFVEPTPSKKSRAASIKAVITKKLSGSMTKAKIGKYFFPKLFLSLIFLVAGVCNFVYAIGSVHSTTELCSKYDKCVLAKYEWNFGEKHCTCLVFANRQMAPTTYAEWTDPEDTTANLAELAISGELRIVQIINRAVPELPEKLRNCVHLQQLILAYTKTESLPAWIAEFSHLEYFHVEGDYTSRRLKTVAEGIFDNMGHLSFLHIGSFPDVVSLPSVSSLKNVRYFSLAVLDSLTEIPSFEGLSSVSDLNLINLPSVAVLPSLTSLTSLKHMVIRPRAAICCNGFISGTCNMTESLCLPIAGEAHPLACTDKRISAEDKALLTSFGSKICPPSIAIAREMTAPSKHSTDELCGGIKYKECTLNGLPGICYNTRMMVINCETTTNYIAMRKLQILRGVGDPCDPNVEAWLGCAKL